MALMLYDVRAQTQTDLFRRPSICPDWSADGQTLFFKGQFKDGGWWRLRMRDRKPERFASWGDMPQDVFLAWFSIIGNDTLVLAREASDDEIYALDWDAR